MEGLYGLHIPMEAVPEDLQVSPEESNRNHHDHYPFSFVHPQSSTSFHLCGPDHQSVPGSSAVSDAGSSMVVVADDGGGGGEDEEDDGDASTTLRAKIATHPLYPKLLEAYVDCHKVWLLRVFDLPQESGFYCLRRSEFLRGTYGKPIDVVY